MVIAGFTAVTSALAPPGSGWGPGHRVTQRAIVSTSFNVSLQLLHAVVSFYAPVASASS